MWRKLGAAAFVFVASVTFHTSEAWLLSSSCESFPLRHVSDHLGKHKGVSVVTSQPSSLSLWRLHRYTFSAIAGKKNDGDDEDDGKQTRKDSTKGAVDYTNPLTRFLGTFLSDDNNNNSNNNNNYDGSASSSLSSSSSVPINSLPWDRPKIQTTDAELLRDMIDRGLREREWFVTGHVMPELFADDFVFEDPDVRLEGSNGDGLRKYAEGVRKLFDQTCTRCEVVGTRLRKGPTTATETDDDVDSSRYVSVEWRLSGKVNVFGLAIKPYLVTSDLRIREDPRNGGNMLIDAQTDTFAVPGWDILLSALVPWLQPFLADPAPPVEEIVRLRSTQQGEKVQAQAKE